MELFNLFQRLSQIKINPFNGTIQPLEKVGLNGTIKPLYMGKPEMSDKSTFGKGRAKLIIHIWETRNE
jgi:hypothetical protein